MTLKNHKLILASQSPRRKELLSQITSHFKVQPSSVEEIILPDRTSAANALAIAQAKALWAARKNPSCFVIGADTLVSLENIIIGKPTDPDDAYRILKSLSGKVHEVITGVVVIDPKGTCHEEACKSLVAFRRLLDEEIDRYVKTSEPLDKAGGYAIQGQGNSLIAFYQGSYSNIVGLPLEALRKLLLYSGFPI